MRLSQAQKETFRVFLSDDINWIHVWPLVSEIYFFILDTFHPDTLYSITCKFGQVYVRQRAHSTDEGTPLAHTS
jgi:hypothetical protein